MKSKGSVFIVSGLILIVVALGLVAYNLMQDHISGNKAEEVLEQMDDGEPSALIDPDREMPVKVINGVGYIGRIAFPSLGIDLPVAAEWNYSNLKIAPCRYTGSVYKNNMVIAAHNYRKHFGLLRQFSAGERVIFTDAENNVFEYTVSDVEIVDPYDIKTMTEGDWDLTLFTCTIGGRTRFTVRCDRAD